MSDDLTKLRKTAKANTVFTQAALRLFVARIKINKEKIIHNGHSEVIT